MASIVLGTIASSIGNAIIPGIGGRILGQIGRQAGRRVDAELGLRNSLDSEGRRLNSLRVQDSSYGTGIPLLYGRVRVAGNVIWVSDLIETRHDEPSGSGKGGGISSAFGGTRTTYTYAVHVAIAIGEGEIGSIATIWADSKVLYQNGKWLAGTVARAGIYSGSNSQQPDPLLEGVLGAGKTPAFRGIAYIALEGLQLGAFGNRLPNFSFEVLPVADSDNPYWTGDTECLVQQTPNATRGNALPPILLAGSPSRVRQLLIGGAYVSGGMATFKVVAYDVGDAAPVELYSASSTSFSVALLSDVAWAESPDGRFVAIYMFDAGLNPNHRIALYDTQRRMFGNVFSVNLSFASGTKSLVWLDDRTIALPDVNGTTRGLRILARAGTSLLNRGFFAVGTSGSVSARVLLDHAQFLPVADGVVHVMANLAPQFTALYGRFLLWRNNNLEVGGEFTIASGLNAGSGSNPSQVMVSASANEWTFVHSTAVDMRLLSFYLTPNGATITRPWQIITDSNLTNATTRFPIPFGDKLLVVSRGSFENTYRLSEITLNASSFTLNQAAVAVNDVSPPMMNISAYPIDGARLIIQGLGGFDAHVKQLGIMARHPLGTTLARATYDILSRVGYKQSEIDVSELGDAPLDGYVIEEQMRAQTALAPLQVVGGFDIIESNGTMTARKQSRPVDMVVSAKDLRASIDAKKDVPLVNITRSSGYDIPHTLAVTYIDSSLDYEINAQRAWRAQDMGTNKRVMSVKLPVVCSATKAKEIAERTLYSSISSQETFDIHMPIQVGAVLDAGDVITTPAGDIRLSALKIADNIVTATGTRPPPLPSLTMPVADDGSAPKREVIATYPSTLFVIDIAPLRVLDDTAGVYIALAGVNGWRGAAVWQSADNLGFSRLADMPLAATCGTTTTTLAGALPWWRDRQNSVDVQLISGTLSSCTDDELLAGRNTCIIGDEILQFRTAVLIDTGLYRLSELVRGRRGSEGYINSHTMGERFILLSDATLRFIPLGLGDRGRSTFLRAVSDGASLDDVTSLPCTWGLRTLRPLSPTCLRGTRAAGGDITINWIRRARLNAEWVDNIDVPLDESVEKYEIDIMNGTAVVRTLSATSSSMVYTLSQQVSDFGAAPASITARVYQISARYGRGDYTEAVI